MNTTTQYQDILEQYPIYMTKDQMYRVCHISKKTCLFLLESGLVPCLDSGKKTRRFKIKTTDVVQYLKDREINRGLYRPPVGYYSDCVAHKKRGKLVIPLTEKNASIMRSFFVSALAKYNDVLTVNQISDYTGYCTTSVIRWCNKQQLKCFEIRRKYMVPKEYLIDFLVSDYFMRVSVKSKKHKKLNEQLYELLSSFQESNT